MTIDYLAILDTGFKVAMGMTLTMASLWASKQWRDHNSPVKTRPEQKKIFLLEEISAEVGRVNHCFAKYSSLVIESTRFGKRWPPARKQELDRINEALVRDFERLAAAEAKLLMLGEKTMEKTLRLYAAKIAFFRKQVYIGRQDISEQEIADIKQGIMQLREQFYELLSRRYDKLLAA
ncbi:MAG: energy transducer TonB [Agarilytica sp.]